jgi:hypothetical protein
MGTHASGTMLLIGRHQVVEVEECKMEAVACGACWVLENSGENERGEKKRGKREKERGKKKRGKREKERGEKKRGKREKERGEKKRGRSTAPSMSLEAFSSGLTEPQRIRIFRCGVPARKLSGLKRVIPLTNLDAEQL